MYRRRDRPRQQLTKLLVGDFGAVRPSPIPSAPAGGPCLTLATNLSPMWWPGTEGTSNFHHLKLYIERECYEEL